MNRPLLLAPLRIEALALRRGAPSATVEVIGKGPVRATAARARLAASEMPERGVLLLGVAGGLSSRLLPGELVVASSVASSEGRELIELSCADEVAGLLRAAGLSASLGPVVSAPSIVRGAKAREALRDRGDIVDMESLWCAPLSSRYPFAVVRAVVDTPGQELFSASTVPHGARALLALSKAARVLQSWLPSTVRSDPLMEACDL